MERVNSYNPRARMGQWSERETDEMAAGTGVIQHSKGCLQSDTDHVGNHRLSETALLLQFHLQLPQSCFASARTCTSHLDKLKTSLNLATLRVGYGVLVLYGWREAWQPSSNQGPLVLGSQGRKTLPFTAKKWKMHFGRPLDDDT